MCHTIKTYSGKHIDLLEPQKSDISIIDIAHGLSKICRFSGQCNQFYSVAQHSVAVAARLPEELKLWGLLHDASEAYLGDVTRPLKRLLTEYQYLEKKMMAVIAARFSLTLPEPAKVKEVDVLTLKVEQTCFWGNARNSIRPWTWDQALEEFINRYNWYEKERIMRVREREKVQELLPPS